MEDFHSMLHNLIKVGDLSVPFRNGKVELEGIFYEAAQKGVLTEEFFSMIVEIMES